MADVGKKNIFAWDEYEYELNPPPNWTKFDKHMDFEHLGCGWEGVKTSNWTTFRQHPKAKNSQQNPALDTQEHVFSCSDLLIKCGWKKDVGHFLWWLNEKHQGNLTLTRCWSFSWNKNKTHSPNGGLINGDFLPWSKNVESKMSPETDPSLWSVYSMSPQDGTLANVSLDTSSKLNENDPEM